VFVASSREDQITLVRFGPGGVLIEHRTPISLDSAERAAPQGVSVAPDGRHYYVTTARGFPNGELLKVAIASDSSRIMSQPPDTVKGREPLESGPAAVQVSPDGAYAWIANASAAGEDASSISVVYLEEMVEVTRIPTCSVAQGSRFTADGSRHYSVCMHDDLLVEIDVPRMVVSRRLTLAPGAEGGATSVANAHGACGPTWAEPSADGARVYVACNQSNEVVEVDVATWTVTRRMAMGDGPYQLSSTHNGKLLVVTNQRGQSVSVVDLAAGRELARLPTKRPGPAGVVISPDDHYAFVAVSGTGSQPGTVEILNLDTLKTVGAIDVFPGAGGIDFWKMGK
jgi:YVTN family beta-propeller protein